jgi:hypothetical protein
MIHETGAPAHQLGGVTGAPAQQTGAPARLDWCAGAHIRTPLKNIIEEESINNTPNTGAPAHQIARKQDQELFETTPTEPSPTDEEIYDAYPRKEAKPAALKSIAKVVKEIKKRPGNRSREENDIRQWLLARVIAFASARNQAIAHDPVNKKFTPHASTYFNQHRFDDEVTNYVFEERNHRHVQHPGLQENLEL